MLHDPATLEIVQAKCEEILSIHGRLEWVADPTLSLPRARAYAWHSSGVASWGDRPVGPGDLSTLMRTLRWALVPRTAARGRRRCDERRHIEPFVLMLPLALASAAADGETELVHSPLAQIQN